MDLQIVILALLEKTPAHGYELIKALEEHSNGFYTPSPGVIYPALTYLEELGHAGAQQEGNRKRYHLTSAGLLQLDTCRETARAIMNALSEAGKRMVQLREAFASLNEVEPHAADELHNARHTLRRALLLTRGCTALQAKHIVEILERAAAEIRKVRS